MQFDLVGVGASYPPVRWMRCDRVFSLFPVFEAPGGGTVAEQSIISSGPLGRVAAWVWRSLTRRYLAIEAAGLKQRSERVAAASSRMLTNCP